MLSTDMTEWTEFRIATNRREAAADLLQKQQAANSDTAYDCIWRAPSFRKLGSLPLRE
jgi:hypothetical protein